MRVMRAVETHGETADTTEHDSTGEAKLNTLNMEHKTVKIKQEAERRRPKTHMAVGE